MERRGIRSAKLAILVSAVVFMVLGSQLAAANIGNQSNPAVVIVDRGAISGETGGMDAMISFIGLLGTLDGERPITFIDASDLSSSIGPFVGNDPGFGATRDEIKRILSTSVTNASDLSSSIGPFVGNDPGFGATRDEIKRISSISVEQNPSELFKAISQAHNIFGSAKAPRGSSVYLVSGSNPDADFAEISDQLTPTVSRFGENGWPIYGIALPDASESAVSFLSSVASMSGGRVFDLSNPDGFTELTNSILTFSTNGSLSRIGGGALDSSELLATSISIAPGTKETTLFFFKKSPLGSLRLSNPSGFEASAGDRSESYVLETPNAVVWRLVDPAPGNWRVDVRGVAGPLMAWEYSTNKYDLVLDSLSPLPLNEPGVLVAHVREGDDVAIVEGATLFARITTPNGARLLHEMNDQGTGGDAVAGDGFHAMTLPPLRTEGEYNLQLELSWPQLDHRVSSQTSFEAAAFPTIDVWMSDLSDLKANVKTQIATASIHVRDEPFPVDAEEFVASLSSPDEAPGVIEIEAKRRLGRGPAWEYDVFFTPSGAGLHTLVFRLNMEYAGRGYTHSTKSFVISSLVPAEVVKAAAETAKALEDAPVQEAKPVVASPPLQTPPISTPTPDESPVPQILLAIAGASLALILAAVVITLIRPRPYGYLYDDHDEPLVDFGKLPRNPVLAFLYRSSVRGRELGVQGLEGTVFHFGRDRVRVSRSERDGPTVRVNNEPLIERTTMDDRSWIGSGGKLYSFLMSPPSAMAAAGGDD